MAKFTGTVSDHTADVADQIPKTAAHEDENDTEHEVPAPSLLAACLCAN
jgi:hypothetical protein